MAAKYSRKYVEQAITGIDFGFTWSDTSQGHEYWARVAANLRDINRAATHEEVEEATNGAARPIHRSEAVIQAGNTDNV